ncbi:MAG: VWA domain-containing protein [Anaerolineae bacterium]
MSRQLRHRPTPADARLVLALLTVGLFGMTALCCGFYSLVSNLVTDQEKVLPTPIPPSALVVAYSPEKELVFRALVDRFNEQGFRTSDGQKMWVGAVELDPQSMIEAALEGSASFQALSPDSSIWLGQLDLAWSEQWGSDRTAVGETVRYAISPVVIAMWEELAREMGWPDQSLSWQGLLTRAQTDPDFRWSHPSTSSASGLLATLAEFYAGAGKTRGLTIEDVQARKTLDYVAALEKTVRYYGEGNEPAIVERALQEGRDFLDAFVVQEQMVVYFNMHRPKGRERLVALYPVEGALWEDHPLALLESAKPTPLQRQVFARFRDYLLASEAQQLILQYGYRPADLSIPLDASGSPLTLENGATPSEPKTALQVPNASIIQIVRDVWWYTKRHTNVYLVADTSGSMAGDKLDEAQAALRVFLDQIKGDEERVGLIQFASDVHLLIPLDTMGRNRKALEMAIDGLQAGGDTALLDAVYEAYRRLQELGDSERINAVVVMTDGQENASSLSLGSLTRKLNANSPARVLIFCIAYGRDADMDTLQTIAEPSGGQVYRGDPETIRGLYKILSTYF